MCRETGKFASAGVGEGTPGGASGESRGSLSRSSLSRNLVSRRLRDSGDWLPTLPKRGPNKRLLNVNTSRPGVRGRPLANRPGSRVRSIPKKFSPCLLGYRTPLFEPGSEFPAGMLAGFARAAARIHGIGRPLRSSLALSHDGYSEHHATRSTRDEDSDRAFWSSPILSEDWAEHSL